MPMLLRKVLRVQTVQTKFSVKQITSGFLWKWIERTGTQFIQFFVQIILARLLLPEEYGLIALVAIFILFGEVFVQSGFNTALVYKKEASEVDYNSVLMLSIVTAVFMYLLLFFLSPIIASYYNQLELVIIIRVLSIKLFMGAVISVLNAMVSRRLLFKLNFKSSLVAISISGTVGVFFAYQGYGVWALVIQQLISNLVNMILLLVLLRWRPKIQFSLNSISELFSYGSRILLTNSISLISEQIYGLFIGKVYNSEILGYFHRGHQFPHMIGNNVNGTVKTVLLPVLSSEQHNIVSLKRIMSKTIAMNSFIVFPLMAGLAAIAEPLIILILTEKWVASVPFLRFESVFYATMPILIANVQVNRAIGRSDISLKLEILKSIMTFVFLAITISLGIYYMMLSRVLIALAMVYISAKINEKLIGYQMKDMISDLSLPLIGALLMSIVVYPVQYLDLNLGIIIILQVFTGMIFYIGFAHIVKIESLYVIKKIIRGYISK